ncbi:MAG TPA: hypothetical protein VK654_08500 [Nitrospirota bacterium]|nr:hypothetical protein [Nitrospirota bacterium]
MNPSEDAPDKGLKKAVLIGAISGAVITLAIALSLDLFFADTMQGSWREAAAKDAVKMFGPVRGSNPCIAISLLVAVMGFLAAFGALLGAVAGLMMNRFFKLVLKL